MRKIGSMLVCCIGDRYRLRWIDELLQIYIKPDNVLVDWTEDHGEKVVTRVVLGDSDIACKLSEGESRLPPHAIGNSMWRSPEAQTGLTGRAGDVFSLGLVVSPPYTFG